MAGAAISRSLLLPSKTPLFLSSYNRLLNIFYTSSFLQHHQTPRLTCSTSPKPTFTTRLFSSESDPDPTSNPIQQNRFKVNTSYAFPETDSESEDDPPSKKPIDKSKLPPPYDPFNKKPIVEDPQDPKDLQQIFHKMRTEGLTSYAVKMFDALSRDGLTHEALELFSQIKDKGNMPEVIAHTSVIEVYVNAGQAKEALKVYMRMLACGVLPNAYTYSVLIKGLASDGKMLGEAKKYLLEMMNKGMRPNAGTYVAVFEGFVREGKVEQGKEFLEVMIKKGFNPDEKAVREVLGKRGQAFRGVMRLLFEK
ncbi:Pentatricopeptide repeat [Dillenia turbinata]|uniref:Pentatricopeptide repeat n=1 Tax=Dillenia turbinata TaxID=194707 RepID=A0AAN8UKK1_9MAGN